MEHIAALVGSVTGVLSLLGIVYMLGRWKGQVDTRLRDITNSMAQYPPAETALMVKTLWDIYVVDALRGRPDLAEHRSAFKLSKEAHDMIPDALKPLLDQISQINSNPGIRADVASGYLVVKYLGMGPISQMAEDCKLSVQEAIAILSTYLDEKLDPPLAG